MVALLHRCWVLFACMSQLSLANSVCAICDAVRCGAVRRWNRSTQNTWINHSCSCEKDKPFYICIFCARLRVARCFKYTTYTMARGPKWSGRLSSTSQLMGIRNANGGNSTKISRLTNWHTHTATSTSDLVVSGTVKRWKNNTHTHPHIEAERTHECISGARQLRNWMRIRFACGTRQSVHLRTGMQFER